MLASYDSTFVWAFNFTQHHLASSKEQPRPIGRWFKIFNLFIVLFTLYNNYYSRNWEVSISFLLPIYLLSLLFKFFFRSLPIMSSFLPTILYTSFSLQFSNSRTTWHPHFLFFLINLILFSFATTVHGLKNFLFLWLFSFLFLPLSCPNDQARLDQLDSIVLIVRLSC